MKIFIMSTADSGLHEVSDAGIRMFRTDMARERKTLAFTAFWLNLAVTCEQRRICPMGVFHSLPFNLPISSSGLLAAWIQVIVRH
jgi:hypothetical protein